jgi:ribosomal protein L34E
MRRAAKRPAGKESRKHGKRAENMKKCLKSGDFFVILGFQRFRRKTKKTSETISRVSGTD